MDSSKLVFVGLLAALIISLAFYPGSAGNAPKKFASENELKQYLASSPSYGYGNDFISAFTGTRMLAGAVAETSAGAPAADSKAADYSSTNVQIEGVDEADIVKNDGKYIYAVSGSKIHIIDAYPAEAAKIVSTIELPGTQEIFINGDRLVAFSNDYNYGYYEKPFAGGIAMPMIAPDYYPYTQKTSITVYDITDRASPAIMKNATVDGSYTNSRMIGDYVYAVISAPADREVIPMLAPEQEGFPAIYYFDMPGPYSYTNVVTLNTQTGSTDSKAFLIGSYGTMFVSQNNIYLAYQKIVDEEGQYQIVQRIVIGSLPTLGEEAAAKITEVIGSNLSESEKLQGIYAILYGLGYSNSGVAGIAASTASPAVISESGGESGSEGNTVETEMPSEEPVIKERIAPEPQPVDAEDRKRYETILEKIYEEITRESDRSVVHRIELQGGTVEHAASGEVPGTPLNQFAMDEHNGYFRIATTTNSFRSGSTNNMYTLDLGMGIAGRLEGMAEGERIYSVRFMGDRAYVVTFRQIDPFFVIDLSNPTPKVLGELKLPGVSDYLHPYDENHIIGVGRDADTQGRVNGIKISVFDVTNPAEPVESASYKIGGRGTYSAVLYDHKAFLFDKEKGILVLPILLTERDYEYKTQGAFVFDVSPANITLRGTVEHNSETGREESYYGSYEVRRSLYMDDTLYTISMQVVKANDLTSLEEINTVRLE